jgi:[ribosomal protein S18]-alanine N-acetyltransferase
MRKRCICEEIVVTDSSTTLSESLLINQIRQEDVMAIAEIERATNPSAWTAEMFAQQLELSQARLLCARAACVGSEQPVGFCVCWLVGNELQLLSIAVAPSWQRRGIAGQLLRRAIVQAVEQGATELTLEVREGNVAAQQLYRAHGCVVVSVRRGYYQDGENAVLMTAAIGA